MIDLGEKLLKGISIDTWRKASSLGILEPAEWAEEFQRRRSIVNAARTRAHVNRALWHAALFVPTMGSVQRLRQSRGSFWTMSVQKIHTASYLAGDLVVFGLIPETSRKRLPFAVFEQYESRLREAKDKERSKDWKRNLAKAWANRELLSTVLEQNWLGLKVLVHLRHSPKTATDLASVTETDIDTLMAVVGRLMRFGAVEVSRERFVCSQEGIIVLNTIEGSTGLEF